MLKKFFKKIGKGIKKVGKAIGKPFKKLFKNKFGKILGTIGLMFIAPWLMQGMGTFFGGVFQGQGVATSFSKAMTQMGTQATNAFNTVTGGIKGMFTKGVPTKAPVDLTTATTDLGNAIQKDSITKSIDFTKYSTDVMPKGTDFITKDGISISKDLSTQALETGRGRLGVVGEETASGKLITGGELGETIKFSTDTPKFPTITKATPDSLLKPQGIDLTMPEPATFNKVIDPITGDVTTQIVPSPQSTVKWGETTNLKIDPLDLKQDPTKYTSVTSESVIPKTQTEIFQDQVKLSLEQGTPDFIQQDLRFGRKGPAIQNIGDTIPEGFSRYSSVPGEPSKFRKIYDSSYAALEKSVLGQKPFKNMESLPGFIREGTVGEGFALRTALQKPKEPYQQPYSDMSGAYAALSNVDLSGGMGLDQIGPSVPNAMAMTQAGMDTGKWLDLTKKYGYIYDASRWG